MAKKKKAAPPEMVLVGSKVKAALRNQDVNVGQGTLEALNDLVHRYICQAALRAKANGRKTVRAHDIVIMD